MLKLVAALLALSVWPMTGPPAQAQLRPLPDAAPFLEDVRKRLHADEARQRDYAYTETRRRWESSGSNRPRREVLQVFESYPGEPGQRRWRRLVYQNRGGVPADAFAQMERDRRQVADQYSRMLETADRSRSAPSTDAKAAQRTAYIDEAFRVFDMRMLGRERLDGRDVIAFVLTPRPDAAPQSRLGRMMRHVVARAWVTEHDRELVRMVAEAREDITVGFGLVARIHKGSRAEITRRPAESGVWVPAAISYSGSARFALFRTVNRGEVTEYSNYRRLH